MITDKYHIIHLISENKSELQKKYPLESIALFGSYARDEQTTESDIDLLVEFNQPVGMEIVDLVLELEELFHQKVDLVTYNAVKNKLYDYIKDELIYV